MMFCTKLAAWFGMSLTLNLQLPSMPLVHQEQPAEPAGPTPPVNHADALRELIRLTESGNDPLSVEPLVLEAWIQAGASSDDPRFVQPLRRLADRLALSLNEYAGDVKLELDIAALDALFRLGGSEEYLQERLQAYREFPYAAGNAIYILARVPTALNFEALRELRTELEREGMVQGLAAGESRWRTWMLWCIGAAVRVQHLRELAAEIEGTRQLIAFYVLHGAHDSIDSLRVRLEPARVWARAHLNRQSSEHEREFKEIFLSLEVKELGAFTLNPTLRDGSHASGEEWLAAKKLGCVECFAEPLRQEIASLLRRADTR